MCRSQGRESLVHNGGLLWVVKSGWNMVQGPGSGGVSHEAGGPCGQELTYQCWGPQNIRLNPQRDCLRGLDALTKRTPGTTNQLPSPPFPTVWMAVQMLPSKGLGACLV